MLAADVGRIYYQSTPSHAAAASVAVAVSASMTSSINCRHSVDMPARRAPRLGPVVTMLDGGGTIEVIRGARDAICPADIEVHQSAYAGDIQMNRFR